MQIKCQIEVLHNFLASAIDFAEAAIGFNEFEATGSESAQAILFLAKSTFSRVLLVYCTTKDKEYIKHIVQGNVRCLVASTNHPGKAAIQLYDPPIIIRVSEAQPSELYFFLMNVELAMIGDPLESRNVLSYILLDQTQHVSPTNKMIVLSRQDYRFVLEFPTTLKSLTLFDCGLSCVDSRIATLKSIVELNLSSNNIQDVSEALSCLNHLLVLDLSRNELEHLPSSAFLQNSKLTALDLSHNKLKELPNSICNLVELCHLNISFNRLRCLPRRIHQLRCLRTLQAEHNKLLYLPVSFLTLPRYCYIDTYGNDFLDMYNLALYYIGNNIYNNRVFSLQQLCGRVIRKENLFYNNIEVLPYPLICYLNNALPCQCQSYCFEDKVIYFPFDVMVHWRYLITTTKSIQCRYLKRRISFEAGLCSSKCLILWTRYFRRLGFSANNMLF